MAAAKLKLTIDQGATYRKTWTWKAGDPLLPVNLTGAVARMHIRAEVDSPDILIELTSTNGGLTLGGVAGTIVVYIPASVTSALTWSGAVYDVEVEFPATPEPDVRRILQGQVVVTPQVTR